MSLARIDPGEDPGHLAQDGVAGVVPVRVVDRLEAVDVDEGDAQRLVVAPGAVDLGGERGEEGLAVRNAGEPVMGGARLGQEEGSRGRVEGLRQSSFGRDAHHAQLGRTVGLEGMLEGVGDAAQSPAEVAPGEQRHRRHPGDRRDREHGDERGALRFGDVRGDAQRDGDEGGHGQRGEEPEGANEAEHLRGE